MSYQKSSSLTSSLSVLGLLSLGSLCGLLGVLGLLCAASSEAASDDIDAFIFFLAVGIGAFIWAFKIDSGSKTSDDVKREQQQAIPDVTPGRGTVYTVSLTRDKWNSEQARRCTEQLLAGFPGIIFRIQANHSRICWQLVDTRYHFEPGIIEQLIRATYPGAEVETQPVQFEEASEEDPFYRYISYYQQANMFVAPMLYVTDIKQVDPLVTVTETLNSLQPGERVSYVVGCLGEAVGAHDQGMHLITQSTIHPLQLLSQEGIGNAIAKVVTQTDRTERFVHRDQQVLTDKLREELYNVVVMLQVDAPDQGRLFDLMVTLDTQLANFTHMPYNGLNWVKRPFNDYTRYMTSNEQAISHHALSLYAQVAQGHTQGQPPHIILEPREIAALWHLPHEGFGASRIEWGAGTVDITEPLARLDDGLVLGAGRYQGQMVEVRIPQADRVTHMNIIGKTGTGKSTLLHRLVHQDIVAGRGVAVVDPHGDLVYHILRSSIPAEREADVVVLDLADEAHPPPLNPLSGMQGYASSLRVIGIIERLFEGTENAARLSSYLRAALLSLHPIPGATMRDVSRLFMDETFREACLERVDNPETQDFWDYQYHTVSPAMQRQIADPVLNRIRPFYSNPHLYPMLCHPDTLDFCELIRHKKIILISLEMNTETVAEQERNLIGALIVSRLQMAGTQAQVSDPYYIYIDEVQKFITTALSELFSEARKYGLSLVTANQFLGQLTGKTLDALMGNVGTTVVFRSGLQDARKLAGYMSPQFTAEDLINLDRFQGVVKLQANNQTQPAFSLEGLPPLDVPQGADTREQALRELSRQHYTPKSREDVLAWLRERYPRRKSPAEDVEATFYE